VLKSSDVLVVRGNGRWLRQAAGSEADSNAAWVAGWSE
jgi:hypothetical protein